MKGYQIVRGPVRKPVSGIYRERSEAVAKADDLDSARCFTYRVRRCDRPAPNQ